MTSEDQPAAPARLHPETAAICVGRPGHAAGGPLNTPIVLASNFHVGSTGEDGRAYSRTDATPGREALETAVGQVEGGTVAFSSGMASIAAALSEAGVAVAAADVLTAQVIAAAYRAALSGCPVPAAQQRG